MIQKFNKEQLPPIVEEAPLDGKLYGRKDGNWEEANIQDGEFVKIQSDVVQLIDSDLALDNDSKLFIEAQDTNLYDIIGLGKTEEIRGFNPAWRQGSDSHRSISISASNPSIYSVTSPSNVYAWGLKTNVNGSLQIVPGILNNGFVKIAPTDPLIQTVVAKGISGGYVYTTIDGWNTVIERTNVGMSGAWSGIDISAINPLIQTATRGNTTGNIFTTTDGWATFTTRTNVGNRAWYKVRIAPSDPLIQTAIVGDVANGYIYTTIDGWNTFTERSNVGLDNWYSIDISGTDPLYQVATTNTSGAGKTYITTDGWATYTIKYNNCRVVKLFSDNHLIQSGFSITPGSPSTNKIWVTLDGWDNWMELYSYQSNGFIIDLDIAAHNSSIQIAADYNSGNPNWGLIRFGTKSEIIEQLEIGSPDLPLHLRTSEERITVNVLDPYENEKFNELAYLSDLRDENEEDIFVRRKYGEIQECDFHLDLSPQSTLALDTGEEYYDGKFISGDILHRTRDDWWGPEHGVTFGNTYLPLTLEHGTCNLDWEIVGDKHIAVKYVDESWNEVEDKLAYLSDLWEDAPEDDGIMYGRYDRQWVEIDWYVENIINEWADSNIYDWLSDEFTNIYNQLDNCVLYDEQDNVPLRGKNSRILTKQEQNLIGLGDGDTYSSYKQLSNLQVGDNMSNWTIEFVDTTLPISDNVSKEWILFKSTKGEPDLWLGFNTTGVFPPYNSFLRLREGSSSGTIIEYIASFNCDGATCTVSTWTTTSVTIPDGYEVDSFNLYDSGPGYFNLSKNAAVFGFSNPQIEVGDPNVQLNLNSLGRATLNETETLACVGDYSHFEFNQLNNWAGELSPGVGSITEMFDAGTLYAIVFNNGAGEMVMHQGFIGNYMRFVWPLRHDTSAAIASFKKDAGTTSSFTWTGPGASAIVAIYRCTPKII